MVLLSNYIGKQVISIYEASIAGIVKSATFDRKMRRICSLLISKEKDDENLCSIPIIRITTADNALTIKNCNSIKPYIKSGIYVTSPVSRPVYTTSGEKKGLVKDVEFDSETFEVTQLILKEGSISAKDIASASDSLIILKGEGFTRLQPPRAKRKKSPFAKSPESSSAQVINTEDNQPKETINTKYEPVPEEKPPIEIEITEDYEEELFYKEDEIISTADTPARIPLHQSDKINTPARIISDYSFLLNRLVLANVYSTTGELIILEGTKITANTVDIARRHGKLVELTVGSRLMS